MKKQIKHSLLLLSALGMLFIMSCSKDNNNEEPKLPRYPTTPISPVKPTDFTSVATILSGSLSKGTEVLLYGYLTRQKPGDDDGDEWYFTDNGTDETILDFPTSSNIPSLNQNIYVYGGIDDDNEVDVFNWQESNSKPDPSIPPLPGDRNKGDLTITKVSDILSGKKAGSVYLAGATTTRTEDDCDEWNFDDGSGTIKLDFPTCNVPQSGQAIYVHGQTASDEVDVWEWEPQNK